MITGALCRRFGDRWGYRLVPLIAMPIAGGLLLVSVDAANPYWAVVGLAVCFAAVELNEGAYWGAAMTVGRGDTMAVSGVMNTGGNLGGIIGIPLVGYLSGEHLWRTAFVVGAAFAVASAIAWLWIEVEQPVDARITRRDGELAMWLRHTSVNERRAMLAAYAGYGLDGFDFLIYTFVIPTLITLWGMNKAQAGYIASAALLSSAIGGWGAGVLADRFGRVRILQLTVLWFAVFTFLSGFTHSYGQLLFTRAMQGFGFGGEWSVGSVLVAETIEARHRGKAAGIVQSSWSVGWAAAALAFWAASVLLPPDTGWRVLFWMGILPALLIIYIRRNVQEPAIYLAERTRQGLQQALGVACSTDFSWISSGRRCCAIPCWRLRWRPGCSPPTTR